MPFSQYRFEHVEHRDGTKKGSPVMPFEKWLPRQAGLGDHYYLKCFVGDENLQTDEELMGDVGPRGKPRFQGQFYWTYRKFDRRAWAWEDFRRAQELLLRFNLVLVLEWIDYSVDMIDRVLGWKEPPKQVLPWNNNQRKNTTSWSAKANIPEQELLKMKANNALGLLLYHWVKRIVAERLACQEY
uniref:Uncharacterized protein n=1 Tax=Heterosigma akashiwo TaxID=2829 RepID=A0A7S3Y0B9_HETAK